VRSYLGGISDCAVVVSQQIGELSKIDLGGRSTGKCIKTSPPVLELLFIGLRTILGDSIAICANKAAAPH